MTPLLRCRLLALAIPLALVPAPARAQAGPGDLDASRGPFIRAAGAIRIAAESSSGSVPVSARRDPLWNGAVIGAGLGAIAGALGGATAIECSECAGFNVPLTFGVLGAAAGAGLGAAIDALRHARAVPPTPTDRRRRVTVAPLVGKNQRALVATVRF
jgi:hypothetical protein